MKLLILLALCSTVSLMPMENRTVQNSTVQTFCEPQTPCAWTPYHEPTKQPLNYMVNQYCECAADLSCKVTDDDLQVNSYIYHCRPEDFESDISESFTPVDNRNVPSGQDSVFSPLANSFQSRGGHELLNLLAQQEPRAADIAPSAADVEDALLNFRLNGNDIMFDDIDHNPQYYMGSRAESVASSQNGPWTEGNNMAGNRNGEMIDTFDFLIKSLSSANNYVSMLTREQLSLLRCVRPSLLYEFLQEVARVRSDKRVRRALPNECAFCKNNGENEECYSTHVLKDWRGRVRCPVLRAFRCPRCGATGDHAHTIKYCPENVDGGSDRSNMSSRRRVPPSLLLGGGMHRAAPAAPASSPSPATAGLSQAAIWSTFGMN